MSAGPAEQLIMIDVEASGLHDGSYPTEVAWCSHDLRRGASYLIRPTAAWLSGPWSAEAEQITGISQVMLGAYGLPPGQVARALNNEIGGTTPLSDHPWGDGKWLRMLFETADVEPAFGTIPPPPPTGILPLLPWDPAKAIYDVDALIAQTGSETAEGWAAVEQETAWLRQAAGLVEHRALDDAIGHALALAVVVRSEHRDDPAAHRHALDALVERARALLTEVVRPGRQGGR